ncbi:hypothetical protein STENM223S_03256 [Streptomyces tendae]
MEAYESYLEPHRRRRLRRPRPHRRRRAAIAGAECSPGAQAPRTPHADEARTQLLLAAAAPNRAATAYARLAQMAWVHGDNTEALRYTTAGMAVDPTHRSSRLWAQRASAVPAQELGAPEDQLAHVAFYMDRQGAGPHGLAAQAVVVVQGNWFLYHGAQMPVVAAVAWGVAVGGARKAPPWCFGFVSLLYGVLPVVYAQLPGRFQRPWEVWAAGLVALLAAGVDVLWEKRLRNRSAVLVALSGVVLLAANIWPGSPHLVLHGKVTVTGAAVWSSSGARPTRSTGSPPNCLPAPPVLYLAFGETAYDLDHPGQCRYPIATFLQRTRYLPDVAELKSFKENADCVDHDPAPYAVLERPWFQPGHVDPELWRRVTAVYDCPPGSPGERLVLCVRR